MKKLIIRIVCCFIPIKSWRHRTRNVLNQINLKKIQNFNKIPFHYYTVDANFGDLLNEDLMNYFHKKYYHESSEKAQLTCIGSLLWDFLMIPERQKSKLSMHIFGSGFIKSADSEHEEFCRPMVFHALRGKLSQERCEKIIGHNLDIPLGDPALLIRRMFPDIKPNPVYDVGIICHYVDKNSPFLKNIQFKTLKVKYIDVAQKPSNFIPEVAECKFILSSAMHGLICADSLGIPNKHIILSDKVVGGEYKFQDYYSVFKNFKYAPIYLKDEIITDSDIVKYESEYTITSEEIEAICDNLINAFPRKGLKK